MQVVDTVTTPRAWLIKDWFAEDTNGPQGPFFSPGERYERSILRLVFHARQMRQRGILGVEHGTMRLSGLPDEGIGHVEFVSNGRLSCQIGAF